MGFASARARRTLAVTAIAELSLNLLKLHPWSGATDRDWQARFEESRGRISKSPQLRPFTVSAEDSPTPLASTQSLSSESIRRMSPKSGSNDLESRHGWRGGASAITEIGFPSGSGQAYAGTEPSMATRRLGYGTFHMAHA